MTVDEFFGQIEMLEALVQAKMVDYDRLWAIATKTTPGMDGMPHGTNITDKVGGIGARLADLSREINALIDSKSELVKVMQKLPPNEYKALYRHYVLGMTWEAAAEDMYISPATIYRYREKGRENLKVIVNDIV